jgi:hypothetical protein
MISSSASITLVTFCAILSSIAEIHWSGEGGLMLMPLKAALICQIKDEVLRVPSNSCTRLATALPHAIGILYVLVVAGGCLTVGEGEGSSGSGVLLLEEEVEEMFMEKLVEASWSHSCSTVGSISEESGGMSLRLFCHMRG